MEEFDSANPPSLPEVHLPDVAELGALIFVSHPLQNLAPGVGGGNPLQKFFAAIFRPIWSPGSGSSDIPT